MTDTPPMNGAESLVHTLIDSGVEEDSTPTRYMKP